jgi:methylmalonyl-CoA decarboxylase subunit alpha
MSTSTAQKRICRLADSRSFEPFDSMPGTATLSGIILVGGRRAYVTATDPDPASEAFDGPAMVRDKIRLLETVAADPAPLITLTDAPGKWQSAEGRTLIPDHADELHAHGQGVGRMYCLQGRLAGVVPRVSVLLGKTGAANSFPMALADAVVMAAGAGVSIGRPDAVRTMIGQEVDYESLAGARMHCMISGVGDALADTEDEALGWVRRWLPFFPDSCHGKPPVVDSVDPAPGVSPDGIVPADPARTYDMRRLIETFTDRGNFLEIQELHAREITTGLARIGGRCAGIVASNPAFRGGVIFPETCRKMTRFITNCNAFGIRSCSWPTLPASW